MKFGINNLFAGRQDTDARRIYGEALDQIVLAEELGFTSVWMAEHHFSNYGLLPHIATFAAAAAARTTTIRLGTAVLVLPFGNPVRLAEEMAMVDVLSNGRLELGVGRGYQPQEFSALGVDPEHSQAVFDEYLEIMRRAWSNERLTFHGEHYDIDDVEVLPKPVQPGGPPVRIAAVSRSTYERLGARGELLMLSPNFTPVETVRDNLASYHAAAAAAGHDPATLHTPPMIQQVYIDESDAVAKSDPEPYAMWFFGKFSEILPGSGGGDVASQYEDYLKIRASVDNVSYDRIVSDGAAFGDPKSIIDRFRMLEDELGVTEIACWFNFGDLPHERVVYNMKLFAETVMPEFAT
jgi:alkanesulfonate monooxygenase SsuD/methylene tetrahydromethanopterin reductase-like flavin-dependent oxidoreductase (luciferase family)